jgi:hypothetical protein
MTGRDLTDLPWLVVVTELAVFAVAVGRGRVVGGAPYGMASARRYRFDAHRMCVELKKQGPS